MKTYVVNMLKDASKREQMKVQLVNHPELDYQIWDAVEGRKLTDQDQIEFISPAFYQRYGKNATLPAAGCSLSHVGIYKDIIKTDTDYALILEDDAILSNDLKLDSIVHLLLSHKPTAILLTPDFWYNKKDVLFDIDEKHKVVIVNEGNMTSGYLINKAGARLIAGINFPVKYTADSWKDFCMAGLSLFGVVCHVVSFPDGLGEIGRSVNIQKTSFQRIRNKLVLLYISMTSLGKFLKGMRRSNKIWK